MMRSGLGDNCYPVPRFSGGLPVPHSLFTDIEIIQDDCRELLLLCPDSSFLNKLFGVLDLRAVPQRRQHAGVAQNMYQLWEVLDTPPRDPLITGTALYDIFRSLNRSAYTEIIGSSWLVLEAIGTTVAGKRFEHWAQVMPAGYLADDNNVSYTACSAQTVTGTDILCDAALIYSLDRFYAVRCATQAAYTPIIPSGRWRSSIECRKQQIDIEIRCDGENYITVRSSPEFNMNRLMSESSGNLTHGIDLESQQRP